MIDLTTDETSHLLYHYTKASTAIEHILASSTIRLAAIPDMNDPWEERSPSIGFTTGYSLPDFQLNEVVRRVLHGARAACFCQDDLPALKGKTWAQAVGSSAFGWARDRMWAQYADNHRGVCLCFDRTTLVSSFRESLAQRGKCIEGDVTYDDDDAGTYIDYDEARKVGSEEYARRFREDAAQEHYLRKRKDWEGEREFRIVLLDARPWSGHARVPIRDSLKAIIVGHRFSDAYRPCLEVLHRDLGIRTFKYMCKPPPHLAAYCPALGVE
jgi:hypothetical protein